MSRILLLASMLAACSGPRTTPPPSTLTLLGAPRCAPNARLVNPVAVHSQQGSFQHFGTYAGDGDAIVMGGGTNGQLVLKFGICPNRIGAATYSCASYTHDGVRYYAERTVEVDVEKPETLAVPFVAPDGSALLCTDGKPAA
jgi:hypothetical protein